MKDIEAVLGNNQYARLRFGVGNDFAKGQQADYVLDNWSSEESNNLDKRIEQCIKIIQAFSTIGITKTMSDFNGK